MQTGREYFMARKRVVLCLLGTALAASLFHYKELEIRQVKEYLRDNGLPVRL